MRARALLLATGATDRAVPFPGWTLPGVVAEVLEADGSRAQKVRLTFLPRPGEQEGED